jgi:hypothetical protein
MIGNPSDGMTSRSSFNFSTTASFSAGMMRTLERDEPAVGNRVFDCKM